jgi:hypothetical protein
MTDTETRSPFRGRGFIAAAVVVGVIVLAAIIVLVTSLAGGGNEPGASPTRAPSATPTSSAADESVCGLKGFDTENTLTTAPENDWELVGTVAAPTEPKGAGPGVTDEGFRSCYSHTAEGALYATVNWFALSSDARNLPRLPELVEPGEGRDAAIAAASAGTPVPSETRLQVAGFKINSYDGQEAVVDVAWTVTSEGGALVSLPTVLHWVNGDWKIVLTDEGMFPYASAPLANLGGYTPWAGV